jgi:hypothetical protein
MNKTAIKKQANAPKSVHVAENTRKEGFRFMEIKKLGEVALKYSYYCKNGIFEIELHVLDGTAGWKYIAGQFDVENYKASDGSIYPAYGNNFPSYVSEPGRHVPVKNHYWKEFDKLAAILYGEA